MFLVDNAGSAIFAGISDNLIFLRNNDLSGGVVTNFVTTNAYHDYTLSVVNNLATLTVDGNALLSTSVSNPGSSAALNSFNFGDISSATSSQTRIQMVYGEAVPEPISLIALPLILLLKRKESR